MKSSAIIRIIIWSLVIVILLGLLLAGLGFGEIRGSRFYRYDTSTVQATGAPGDTASSGTYTAKQNQSVRQMPTDDAAVTGSLSDGDAVIVERTEMSNGITWALISSPVKGWVPDDCLESSAAASDSVPADQVDKIAVDWVSGTVTIQPDDVDEISFYEDSSKYPMVWKLQNGKLTIRFCQEERFSFNLTVNKNLTILVPRDFALDELELDAASANLNASDMTIRSVELDIASGACRFQNCDVAELEVDTASGDVFFEGSLDSLDFDAASASFHGVLTNTPSRIDVDSASGNLELTLPEDTGFSVGLDGLSCDFSSDFATTLRNGRYTYGDGRCRIDMDGMSSDIIIHRGSSEPAVTVPAVPEVPDAPDAPDAPEPPTAP